MKIKKSFKTYYLLLAEGTTEFNLFAYLTKNRFKELFAKSSIQFSNKVEIIKNGEQIVSQGKLNGVGNLSSFTGKYNLIKKDDRYKGEKLFFVLDKDLNDSTAIEKLISKNGDIVQFLEYNSEYLLLKFKGADPKNPPDFKNLADFRNYCKSEFQKQFQKNASALNDFDFDIIFKKVKATEIQKSFSKLFSTTNIL